MISQPFINDGYFKRSVVLLVEHNEHGTMGFVMNKRMNLRIKDVLPQMDDIHHPLFKGGPVADNQLFFIHRFAIEINSAMPIGNTGWYWGGDFNDVVALLKKRKAGFNDIHFFIGYSGWEAGQLENELKEKAWFVADANFKSLMHEKFEEIWGNELKRMGSNFSILANFPEDPSIN
ncbi:MAG: YqgE/AlgH family protein [Bacteroidia bacterium]